jgi:hypothetical protein
MEGVHRRLNDGPSRRYCLLAPLYCHFVVVFVDELALIELGLDPRSILLVFLVGTDD